MKELVFKLKTNDEVVIDVKTTYFMKDDVLNFVIEDNIYRFNTSNKILNKENDESIMNIDMVNNRLIYVHKELNKEFELPLDNNDLSIKDNNYIYKYEVKDNNLVNIIEISY